MNIFLWLKKNLLVVILLIIILILLFGRKITSVTNLAIAPGFEGGDMIVRSAKVAGIPGIYREAAPTVTDQRLVVQDTNLSMQVNDVSGSLKEIEKLAVSLGGYMVDRSMTSPEGADSGSITLRVPTEKREEALEAIRKMGVKVISENTYGYDVTDQYVDIETRITNLENVKTKMQAILDQAVRVEDLMNVQIQINSIQEQIDSLKGQKNYLEQTAKLTKITVDISTDELALPYTPDEAWRPAVVFKTAVRSVLRALRSVANAVIWGVVYLPAVLLVVGLIWMLQIAYRKYFRT